MLEKWQDTRSQQGKSTQKLHSTFFVMHEIVHEEKGTVLILIHSACIQIMFAEINRAQITSMAKDYPMPNAETIEVNVDEIVNKFAYIKDIII